VSAGVVLLLGCVTVAIVLACASCSSNGAQNVDILNPTPEPQEADSLLEVECETQLLYLSSRIQSLGSGAAGSDATSTKLKELYSMSEELFLKREYALALTLMDEAVRLIEELGD
jgi:hypothetical protein